MLTGLCVKPVHTWLQLKQQPLTTQEGALLQTDGPPAPTLPLQSLFCLEMETLSSRLDAGMQGWYHQ